MLVWSQICAGLASYRNQSCSNESTNYFENCQFLVESNGGYDLRPQDHPSLWRQRSSVRPIFSHIYAEFFISYKSVMDTLEEPLLALILELIGDVVFPVSWLLPVSVPVRSPFLYIVVRDRKEVHRVLDEFLILLCSFSQEVPARAVDYANVPVW